MHRRNAGPPEIQWQLMPPSGRLVSFFVPLAGKQVRVSYFLGHMESLIDAGFGEALLVQIALYRNHEFRGSTDSTYFRYRTASGTRYRVTVLFTQDSVEVSDLECEAPAMTA